MRLVFASNNAHKLEEVRAIMPAGIEVLSLREVGFLQEIDETGTTLSENSRIKAETVVEWLKANGEWTKVDGVFADDTGLEIDALDGKPGVYTARWYLMKDEMKKDEGERTEVKGEKGIFSANRAKALRELDGKDNRSAQFKTVVTLIQANGRKDECLQMEGVVRGWITTEERGEGGFGYDPIFIPEGYDKTFAELPAETKNSISHRARAMVKLVEYLSSQV
ncbi:MAG: RdgB/HAM1 family non-canonical purine NTP pyrophosphatase [Paludibacteraceae bacterium]|nr:RdgB/HAM1 family non-canonical purine NTP pyrophosphatase [Paludibacteraceae bacterium]